MKNSWRAHFSVILLFLAITLIQVSPLLYHITDAIPFTHMPKEGMEVGGLGPADALQVYYKFWLFKDSIVGETPLLSDNYKFSVGDVDRIFSLQLLPLSLLFFIFSFGGGAFAYNMTVIVTTILAGYCSYLLVRYITSSRAAGITAGLIFILIPYNYAQTVGGHPNGFLIFLLPLALYLFERSYRESRILLGSFCGLCLLSLGLIEAHMMYYSMLFYAFYVPFRFFLPLCNKTEYWARLVRILRTGIPILLCLGLLTLYFYVREHSVVEESIAGGGRGYTEVLMYSPDPDSLFERTNENAEMYIYVGLVSAILVIGSFVIAFIPNRGKNPDPHFRELRLAVIFMGGVFFVSCFLALGPNGDRFLPLYRFFYRYLPYFNYPRVPGRLFMMSIMAMSVLAGFTVTRAAQYLKERITQQSMHRAVSIILFLMVFIGISYDYRIRPALGIMKLVKENKAYEFVKENVGDEKLLELPIWPGDSSWSAIYMYYTTLTRTHIINGYSPVVSQSYVEEVFKPLKSLNIGEISEDQYEMLKRLKVKYIMLHEEAFPPKVSRYPALFTLENLKHSPYLEFITQNQPVYLFEVLDKKREDVTARVPSSIIGKHLNERHLSKTIGSIVKDSEALGGKAVYAEKKDGKGYLAYKHKWSFPTGKYRAIFRLKYDKPDESIEIRTDIDIRQGKQLLALKEIHDMDFGITNQYRDFVLEYEVKQTSKMESIQFQVEYCGIGELWFDYVYVTFADQEDSDEMVFEAEEMYHIGSTISRDDASAGKAILVTEEDPPGNIAFNLNRRLLPGTYRARYRISAGDSKPGPILCEVKVIAQEGKRTLASAPVCTTSWDNSMWTDVELEFTIDKPEIMDFPVYHTKRGTILFDKVEIIRIKDE